MYRKLLMTATVLSLPVVAAAQPVAGPYVSLGVGWNYLQEQQIKNFEFNPSLGLFNKSSLSDRNINFGSGIVALGAVGYGFGNGLRAEVEGSYRGNYRNQNGNAIPLTPAVANRVNITETGGEQKGAAMVNLLYDFVDAFGHGVTPYVGGGVGYQYLAFGTTKVQGLVPNGPFLNQTFSGNSGSGTSQFGYQAIAGASYNLVSVDPGLYLTLEYRFLGVGGNRSQNGTVFVPGRGGYNFKISSGPEYNQGIVLGVRYAFNTPPPPPPPAPIPAPVVQETRTYLVFFDWDRADLSDRARQIIAEAAQASTRVRTTLIQVNGYADLSGTAAYNQKLSVRRAENVAAELVKDGVPKAEISIHGYGDTRPLVPTAPGVREPQNRRVEIILK